MSTTTRAVASRSTRHIDLLHPLTAAIVAAISYATALTVGEVFDLNADSADAASTSWGDIASYAVMVLAAVALAAWLGHRARSGSPRRLSRYAIGLAAASVVTFVAFWSGWPQVFGAVALVTALEHRRRIGSFGGSALTAAVVGGLALVGSLIICVIG